MRQIFFAQVFPYRNLLLFVEHHWYNSCREKGPFKKKTTEVHGTIVSDELRRQKLRANRSSCFSWHFARCVHNSRNWVCDALNCPVLLTVQTSKESVFAQIAHVPLSDGSAMLCSNELWVRMRETKHTTTVDLRSTETGHSRKASLENSHWPVEISFSPFLEFGWYLLPSRDREMGLLSESNWLCCGVYQRHHCSQSNLRRSSPRESKRKKALCKCHQGGPCKISEAVHRSGRVCPDLDKMYTS